MYSPQVIDHFERPRNMGTLPDANAVGMVGDPTGGDVIRLQLKIVADPNGTERIADVKAKVFGCGSAIAATSLLTELIKGKTLTEAARVKDRDIAAALDLPPVKLHCSVLAEAVLAAAIADYRKRAGDVTSARAGSPAGAPRRSPTS
jgi:nitrogen fixation NifU-like protein